ncbi:hypothetical protein WOLCODRAFT_157317 [Wolfiporia cocos MD-104 SS10]|uniref:Uncharacterized protein n=1 Tax=Wolfiporia cocos (strain MD-104) TaxID=742152 RepID=A0A2H3JIV5_WOLCO|nr:hypothetical protein WOLCODRAFT_157317 [Wolfiporia cocos MD-104 SS10]
MEVATLCCELMESMEAQHHEAVTLLTDLLKRIDMLLTSSTTIGSGYKVIWQLLMKRGGNKGLKAGPSGIPVTSTVVWAHSEDLAGEATASSSTSNHAENPGGQVGCEGTGHEGAGHEGAECVVADQEPNGNELQRSRRVEPMLEARTGRERPPPSFLSTYGEERLPVIAEMLKETTRLLEQRVAAQCDGSSSEAAWNAGDLMNLQLTINCLWSSIVRDERMPAGEKSTVDPYDLLTAKGNLIHAGDCAPDAPGLVDAGADATSLFRVFGPAFHTVLVFSIDTALIGVVIKATEAYSRDIIHVVMIRLQDATDVVIAGGTAYMDLIDREGHAYKNYSVASGGFTAVIVRPDGVVGGIMLGVKGLKGYFDTVYSI